MPAFKRSKRTFKRTFRKRRPNALTTRNMELYRDPPQLNTQLQLVHRFRWQCQTASANDILITDILLSRVLLACVTGSTACNEVVSAFKILSLDYWTPPCPPQGTVSINTNVGAAITWLGGGLAADRTVSAQSLSSDRPAHIFTRPPKNSQASFWALGGGNTNAYFSINNSIVGSFIDIVMVLTINLGAAVTSTFSGASTTTGIVLGRLDGSGGIWIGVPGGISGSIE